MPGRINFSFCGSHDLIHILALRLVVCVLPFVLQNRNVYVLVMLKGSLSQFLNVPSTLFYAERETIFCVLRNNTGSFWDVPHISRHHAKTLYLNGSNYALKYNIKKISSQHFNVNFGFKFIIFIYFQVRFSHTI